MTKAIEDMTVPERMLFDMYCDLEYALIQEYDMYDPENASAHLRESVDRWSTEVYRLGLIDDYLYGQAQKMAAADESWVSS
jgi:hypothetical protein